MDSSGIANRIASGAEDRLIALARDLSGLRDDGFAHPASVERISSGLVELSGLAAECGKIRISRACRTLSVILVRLDKGQEEDVGFILSTALNFLDALQARRIGSGKDAR